MIRSEEEIIRNKFLQQGKPEAALAKIVPSSLKSWFKEVCLVDQLFVKDPNIKISDLLKQVSDKVGDSLQVEAFVRIKVGEAGA